MTSKSEPWYIHAALLVVILILSYILIKVAYIDPSNYMKQENYYKTESHLRMDNIRQAEILWDKKYKRFTDNLDSLVNFVKTDSFVYQVMNGVDTITGKSTNPFKKLKSVGAFVPESLFFSPKTHKRYILQVDTSTVLDTFINRRGKITKVDTNITIGTRYFLKDPDGYGTIGDLHNEALKNTASWE